MLHIVVCMKVVTDPEMPFSEFKVDRENKRPIPPSGVPPVFSPFDLNALESALRIKDSQESRISVLSIGKKLPRALFQNALAAGADDAIAVEDPLFEYLDSYATARVLAAAIEKIGGYNLVFTGRQSADWDAGLVWAGIAETLNLPSITLARSIKVNKQTIIVERCTSNSIDIVESMLPALITFSSEAGELRFINLPSLMKAKKREIIRWSASDIGFKPGNTMQLQDIFIPKVEIIDTYFVPGENPRDKGRNLARQLIDKKVLTRRR
jgi:electron transfer flavoprotein beta subunit